MIRQWHMKPKAPGRDFTKGAGTTMKIAWLALVLSFPQISSAVLQPKNQNMKDLDVMINFIRRHDAVLSTLKSIDFGRYTVHYGRDCEAIFGRREIPKPQGLVGPEDPLEFKRSTCGLER